MLFLKIFCHFTRKYKNLNFWLASRHWNDDFVVIIIEINYFRFFFFRSRQSCETSFTLRFPFACNRMKESNKIVFTRFWIHISLFYNRYKLIAGAWEKKMTFNNKIPYLKKKFFCCCKVLVESQVRDWNWNWSSSLS